MNVYKLIFAKNIPVTCELITHPISFEKEYCYEHNKDHLIYAIIKAPNEEAALETASNIVQEVTAKVKGEDFIA